MQGESAATSKYGNADVAQPTDYDLAEASIDEFTNLVTATAVEHGIVATLTDVNSSLVNN
jgi:hypothetical protein